MRAHSGCRSSAARYLAAMNNSSGISTAVFIPKDKLLYFWKINCGGGLIQSLMNDDFRQPDSHSVASGKLADRAENSGA